MNKFRLFNELNFVQSILIKDKDGSMYTVLIEGRKSTEIFGYQITEDVERKVSLGKLSMKFIEDVNSNKSTLVIDTIKYEETEEESPKEVKSLNEEEPPKEESPKEVKSLSEEEPPKEDLNLKEKLSPDDGEPVDLVCKICGNEFASERGLRSHIARSHKE